MGDESPRLRGSEVAEKKAFAAEAQRLRANLVKGNSPWRKTPEARELFPFEKVFSESLRHCGKAFFSATPNLYSPNRERAVKTMISLAPPIPSQPVLSER